MDLNDCTEELLKDTDNIMPLPSIESDPHLLISKIRKYYLDYITRLLCENYAHVYKVRDKCFRPPSGLVKCAQTIELNAARSCMLVDLYRQNLITVIRKLKTVNKKGKIYEQLLTSLKNSPSLNKKIQTSFEDLSQRRCNCPCTCNGKINSNNLSNTYMKHEAISSIPVIINQKVEEIKSSSKSQTSSFMPVGQVERTIGLEFQNKIKNNQNLLNNAETDSVTVNKKRLSVDSRDDDDVMLQLEQLFGTDSKQQEDDLFESILCNDNELIIDKINENIVQKPVHDIEVNQHSVDLKSLDERLKALEKTGALITNNEIKENSPKSKKHLTKKWFCEIYYKKKRLYEKLDEIRDLNRRKHDRIKSKYLDLFGEDSDDDEVMSPLDETRHFMLSCQERIAPWVVKTLTPFYIKGRIKSKILFKNTVKHLLKIIYQINRYPNQYEVSTFVFDFLRNVSIIRCEADYKKFKIPNYNYLQMLDI